MALPVDGPGQFGTFTQLSNDFGPNFQSGNAGFPVRHSVLFGFQIRLHRLHPWSGNCHHLRFRRLAGTRAKHLAPFRFQPGRAGAGALETVEAKAAAVELD